LERSKDKTKLFANITPSRANWISTGAGRSGVTFNYVISMDWAASEFYIDHDHEAGVKNKAIFDRLAAQREEIEREVGGPLEWERLDDKRASRIRKRFTAGGLSSPDTWPKLQDEMIDAMIRLDRALRNRLAKIEV
jgi:hypothetical protein